MKHKNNVNILIVWKKVERILKRSEQNTLKWDLKSNLKRKLNSMHVKHKVQNQLRNLKNLNFVKLMNILEFHQDMQISLVIWMG